MSDATGFLKHPRELPAKESPAARIGHSQEFVRAWSGEQLHQQSARCMNCGVPFCHSGCPLGNVIPDFNDAVHRGRWREAYEILVSTNNFPEFTGRICPAPCESACVLGINAAPVAIEEIERHIIETAFQQGYVKAQRPIFPSGKRVAVVGSGPAGLAAAAQLNKVGHSVTVFERDESPGGLLRLGIPDFKLEKSVVERRIRLMEAEGIEFRCGANVGGNVPVGEVLREFQAVVLAGGSTVPRDLEKTPGRALAGVHFAMDFLKARNREIGNLGIDKPEIWNKKSPGEFSRSNSAISEFPNFSISQKKVVVIGGGDTGSDCVGTSLRLGAASVTQFELLPEPPRERNSHMPWPQYPMIFRTSTSQEEGCERGFAVHTKAFLGDENGRLRALRIADLEWTAGTDGRPSKFVEIVGSEREIECDLALLAMGFLHPQHAGMLSELDVELDERGNVRAGERHFQTNIAKIFVAGDMRRGQSLVVWAISEGRECARKVDEFLTGRPSALESKDV